MKKIGLHDWLMLLAWVCEDWLGPASSGDGYANLEGEMGTQSTLVLEPID